MKNGGFSIIEVLVVLAIMGALLLIASMSGGALLNKYRVEGQMKEMYVDLMNAKVRALQKNRMHFVTFTDTQYTIYDDTNPGPDGDGSLLPGSDTQVMQKNLNPAYAITSHPDEIDFDSRGLATGFAGTQTTIRVTESFGSATNCLTVSATRIRMGAYDGSACVPQ